MATAPSSNSRRRTTPRVWAAVVALPLVLISGSCVFDLPPVAEDGIGGGIGGSAGLSNVGGATSGSSGTDQGGTAGIGGVAGSGGVPDPCPDGQKRCTDGSCRPSTVEFGCGSSACQPCASAAHAVAGCVDGQCVFTGCEPNYADCNGDTLSATGSGSDGCEYSLGAPAPSTTALQVPFAHIQVDGKIEDWSSVPEYGFGEVCSNCQDQQTPPVSADSTVPQRNDLDARFRVAWDVDKFYLLVEAYDDQLYDMGMAGGKCQQSADCEDGAQLILLGRDDRSHPYFSENERIFLGSSRNFGAPAQGQPSGSDLEIQISRQSKLCYRIEAQVDWAYITNTKSNPSAAPGHFPPAPGQSYGFNIAVNDWDAPISDANAIERQSQVFFTSPGSNFDFLTTTSGIGSMTLMGADAGP